MTKINEDELTELLGYPPIKEFRLQLIAEAEAAGEPLAKIANRYCMPAMGIPDENGIFIHNGEKFTKESWSARWPYRTLTLIYKTTQKNNDNE